jgi:Asp/Glu/hydantoin racemase
MNRVIHVINASSRTDTGITEELARSLAWCVGPSLPRIHCVTLAEGPNGIVTGRDSDRAAPAVLDYVEKHASSPQSAAFVVACFSDPGLPSAREITGKPVIGIGEAGLTAALALGDLVGTIGVSKGQTAKSLRFARRVGLAERYAGHVSLGLDYAELQKPERVETRLREAALRLRDLHHASVIVLAGAGLARYVAGLEGACGLPVVDPTQAAVVLALGQVMGRT